jgi:hypothetical protein
MIGALVDAISANSKLRSRTAETVEAGHHDPTRIPSLRGGYMKAVQYWNEGFGSRPPLKDWSVEEVSGNRTTYYNIKIIAMEYDQLGQEEFEKRYVAGGANGFTKVWKAIMAAKKKESS